MAKKFTDEDREKFLELILADTDTEGDFLENIFGPSKKPSKSLKTPIEKLNNYHLIVGTSCFWASRQVYLELIQSFLSKKINGKTLTSKFFQLRCQNMMNADEFCARIEDNIQPIPDLYYTFKADDFSSAINELFLELDRYDPDIDDWDINDWDVCKSFHVSFSTHLYICWNLILHRLNITAGARIGICAKC